MFFQLECPLCESQSFSIFKYYKTKHHGERKIFECHQCGEHFSETKNSFLEGLKKPISLVQQVLQARTEGMGLNATASTFSISKNTLLNWERKFSNLKEPLLIYSLTHQFIQQVIEGDEL